MPSQVVYVAFAFLLIGNVLAADVELLNADMGGLSEIGDSVGDETFSAKVGVIDSDDDVGDSQSAAADVASMEYAVFKAADGGTLEFDKASHYIRHMGDSAETTTASSEADKRDIVWKMGAPLCAPGSGGCPAPLEGEPKCVSLEAANWKGYYLVHSNSRVSLQKPTGTTLAASTFCIRPGLGDRRATSFEALSKPGHFIRHNGYHLYVCDNTNQGNCGRTSLDVFRKDTTFYKEEPSFFGSCAGPENPTNCECASGRTGNKCMTKCPGLVKGGAASCSGKGVCFFDKQDQTAKCRCELGRVGPGCEEQCPKGLSGQVCSKNGQCVVDKLGQAVCECLGPWRGKTCDVRCPGASDDSVCSGKGQCLYDAVKKETFCKCDEGFLGGKCAVSCPKDVKDRICSGQGKCVPGGSQGGKCECKEGFMGSDCALKCNKDALGRVCGGAERGTCVAQPEKGRTVCECKKGFLGEDCGVACPVHKGNVCAGKGTCFMDTLSKAAKCVCKSGQTGERCHLNCPANKNGDVCDGHGKCHSENDSATCKCTGGFIGVGCDRNCPGTAQSGGKVSCSGNGECVMDDKNKEAACKCKPGFLGAGCQTACPKHEGITCGGQGECFLENGMSKCKCKQGFMGESCQYQCPGRTSEHSCSNRGKCLLVGGKNAFSTKCECEPGFGGRTCEQSCAFAKESGPSGKSVPCFNKGECVAEKDAMKCMCEKGWMGEDCALPCPTSDNGEICSRRGMCTVALSGKTAKCECKDGFSGPSCSAICPSFEGKVCGAQGKCGYANGEAVCNCHKDFAGASCSQECPKDENGTICNGNGKCQLKDGLAVCKCNPGHAGKSCGRRVCGSANSIFDANTARCTCEPGYTCAALGKKEQEEE